MKSFYFIIAILTAGISLVMGLVSFFTGLHKDGKKIDLIFGNMCLCLFIFFLVPPVGFVLIESPINIYKKFS